MNPVIWLVWCHFVADFLLQTDRMATGKSSSSKTLALHVLVYSLCFVWCGAWFFAVTFALHFITDFASSRAAAALWKRGERHWFFAVIGLDQALHLTALVLTYEATR